MEHLELVQYYISVIKSVLEYACPAWFTSVKHKGHMWELELIQIRSLKIIFPEMSFKEALIQYNLCALDVRLTKLCSLITCKTNHIGYTIYSQRLTIEDN